MLSVSIKYLQLLFIIRTLKYIILLQSAINKHVILDVYI